MTNTATQGTYRIETYVDGRIEWAPETITAGANYELGDELAFVAGECAEIAVENTRWLTRPTSLTVVVLGDDGEELARADAPAELLAQAVVDA